METGDILEGIAIIVTCVIGAWQLWLAVVTRNARLAILVFTITASLLTLGVMFRDDIKTFFGSKASESSDIVNKFYTLKLKRCTRTKDVREGYENLGCEFEIKNQREIPRDQSGRIASHMKEGSPALYIAFGEPNTDIDYAEIRDPKGNKYKGIVSDKVPAIQRPYKYAVAKVLQGTQRELWVLFDYPEEYNKISEFELEFRLAYYTKPRPRKYKINEWRGKNIQIEDE